MTTTPVLLSNTTWSHAAQEAAAFGVDLSTVCSIALASYFDYEPEIDNDVGDPFGAPTVIPPGFNYLPRNSASKPAKKGKRS